MATVQFAPWTSDIELPFYSALASRKINFDKLDDAARKVLGRYEVRPSDPPERSTRMQLHGNAFSADEPSLDYYRAEGMLKNVNTIEDYRALNHNATIEQAGRTIWDAIVDGSIFSCPSLLSSFYVIFFADLKKYKFTYHFAFPALHSTPPWKLAEDRLDARKKLEPSESKILYDAVRTWRYSVDPRQHGFFLAKRDRSSASQQTGTQLDSPTDTQRSAETANTASIDFQWSIAALSAYEVGFFNATEPSDRFICFADPSTYLDNPGWPLRNLLVLTQHRWQLQDLQVLCYRDKHNAREHSNSLILHLTSTSSSSNGPKSLPTIPSEVQLKNEPMPKVTGWERNHAGKLAARITDLSAYLDPTKLADQAVDLNLKLMKWRIAPSLDLATIQSTRCLLLGAGTLGSYVARNLLGWGVRHITFVDNGKVSFSNPVRQPLFTFQDCTNGGRPKAERAAEALREIYPGVKSDGLSFSVPMAGHPIIDEADEARVKSDCTRLKDLFETHDAIFLLMDTRESRWLPTVMGKSMNKVVLNAALGFDTYLVMRHGVRSSSSMSSPSTAADLSPQANPTNAQPSPKPTDAATQAEPSADSKTGTSPDTGTELGCYFCTDVVAPADSVRDQTLDQQCTVTRPGIAAIASALTVELFASVLQHPLRARAHAPASRDAPRDIFLTATTSSSSSSSTSISADTEAKEKTQHPLGLVPHTLRGFLSNFDTLLTSGPAYSACSACSPAIVER
ncbi:MAG: hypothetical protein Q9159_004543, partial [Coniocarpon cinnabarinum]